MSESIWRKEAARSSTVLADVKTHDSDGIVEERLAEDDDVEDFVDVDLFEDGDDGHGVDGGDQGRKQKRLQESWKKSIH